MSKDKPLRLVPPPPSTLRDRFRKLRWRLVRAHDPDHEPSEDDRNLGDVLAACHDPELTAELAEVAREHWAAADRDRAGMFDRLIDWLDAWDRKNVEQMATKLIDAIDLEVDRETGAAYQRTRTAEEFARVCRALGDGADGEARLRKALVTLWGDSRRADAALKYRHQRVKRAAKRS